MRIGQGFDAHRFAAGRRLILGGVEIPHPLGLAGHSDADALAHAIADALLGAMGWGDLGGWFPDDDPQWRDADSLTFLHAIAARMRAEGWAPVQVDATVLAERPKLAPYREAMRARLAEALGLDAGCVSVKATTTEGMGFVGRGEGIAAMAVALAARTG